MKLFLSSTIALIVASASAQQPEYSTQPAVYLGAAAKSGVEGFLINCQLFAGLLKEGAGPLLGLPIDNLACPAGTNFFAEGPCTSTQLVDGIPVCGLKSCCLVGTPPTLDPAILQITAAAGAAVVAQAAQIAAEARPFIEAGETSTATQFIVNCGTFYQFLNNNQECPSDSPVYSEYPCTNKPFVDGVDTCSDAVCCVPEDQRTEPNAIGVRVAGIGSKVVAEKVDNILLLQLYYFDLI
eukprot:Awhi_evm3s2034